MHPIRHVLPFLCLLVACIPDLRAQEPDVVAALGAYDVRWDVPGPSSQESMPVGNGDIGLNVWTEPNGDVVFYIGKTDAWSEDVRNSRGLLKLGKVRVSLTPSPLTAGAAFAQVLKLHEGEIRITAGSGADATVVRVWVDANHPVIRVEAIGGQPTTLTVALEPWRTERRGRLSADTIIADQPGRIAWYHRNDDKADPQVVGLTTGAAITGDGLTTVDAKTLRSIAPGTAHALAIHPLTATTASAAEWRTRLDGQVAQTAKLDAAQAYSEHLRWWDAFWRRSWVFVRGDQSADDVTRGYVLQRFVTACGGRGAYPIKFNGSIFVVDDPKRVNKNGPPGVDADYRSWGGQYWFQNTRAMYWPRLMAGDFDVMRPLFDMYAAIVPANTAQVKEYYKHDGVYFAETAPHWGSLKYVGPEVPENWTDHYFTPILELSMMMLDYYEFTGDAAFATKTLVPVASAGVQFFDQHFTRDAAGKLLLDPDNAIEMFWKVHNPAPDIAGLRAVLARMIALPDALVTAEQRNGWKRLLGEIPELPIGDSNRKHQRRLLPYTGPQVQKSHNGENPELYAVYPFRLFGLGKPDFDLARDTFINRRCKGKGCWMQDPVQAAMLGLTDVAKDYVAYALTNREPALKFPAFWAHGNDYQPDQDNGGNGENGLQSMLMYTDGKKILLLPAWPKDWDVEFKLNAPYQTTVQGRFVHGKLLDVVVTPASRAADVVDLSGRPQWTAPPPRPATGVVPGEVKTIIGAKDPVAAVGLTAKGAPNHLDAITGGEGAPKAVDGNIDSKYLNRTTDGSTSMGVNTGFVVTPSGGGIVNAFQIATANDMPDRDPLAITIEGSNAPDAAQADGNGFVTLYDGLTGLDADPGRKTWGPAITFRNTTAYRTYRVLITESRGDATDAVQYAEVRLGIAARP